MTYDENYVRSHLRRYLLTEVLPSDESDHLTDDTRLQTAGILNSVSTLHLVIFLEREFGIEVEAHEVNVSNFDRIGDILAFVAGKMPGGSA